MSEISKQEGKTDDDPPMADVTQSNSRAMLIGKMVEERRKEAREMNDLERKVPQMAVQFLQNCYRDYMQLRGSPDLEGLYSGLKRDGHSAHNEFLPFMLVVNPTGKPSNRGKHAGVLLEALKADVAVEDLPMWIENKGGISKIAGEVGRKRRHDIDKKTEKERRAASLARAWRRTAIGAPFPEGVTLPPDGDYIAVAMTRDGLMLAARPLAEHELLEFEPFV